MNQLCAGAGGEGRDAGALNEDADRPEGSVRRKVDCTGRGELEEDEVDGRKRAGC